jgi:hypothetical protein
MKNFHECSCGTESIMVWQEGQLIELSIWERSGYGHADMGLGQRLRTAARTAWRIVRTGSPWGDQMVLDPQTARSIAESLLSAAAGAEKEED